MQEPHQRLEAVKALGLDFINPKIVKGKVYVYTRSPTGDKPVRLPCEDDDFVDLRRAHEAFIKSLKTQPLPEVKQPVLRVAPSTGTLGQAIIRFKGSTTYLSLKSGTVECYERTL